MATSTTNKKILALLQDYLNHVGSHREEHASMLVLAHVIDEMRGELKTLLDNMQLVVSTEDVETQ